MHTLEALITSALPSAIPCALIDDRQITHLICVRLKRLLCDVFGRCLGPPSCCFSFIQGPKHPLKSHIANVLGGHRLDEKSGGRPIKVGNRNFFLTRVQSALYCLTSIAQISGRSNHLAGCPEIEALLAILIASSMSRWSQTPSRQVRKESESPILDFSDSFETPACILYDM